jgi:hypothetical protein
MMNERYTNPKTLRLWAGPVCRTAPFADVAGRIASVAEQSRREAP